MIYKNIHKFKSDEFRNRAVIAIDFGAKKIGIASSDTGQLIASPKDVFYRKEPEADFNFIKSNLLAYSANIIVFGLALDKDGKITESAQKTKSFADRLNKQGLNIDIFFWDERYTSVESQRLMNFHNVTDKKTRRNDDAVSAAIILSSFLEFGNNKQE